MVTITWRVTKRQGLAAAAAFLAALGLGVWGRAALSQLRGEQAQPAAQTQQVWKEPGGTNQERLQFLEGFGWQVAQEPEEIVEIQIPQELDPVYADYNELQQAQGCDLEKYAGERCKRYSYQVTNYPGQGENVRANLLVAGGKIIGGDICSLELDGFMHGFRKPGETEGAVQTNL